MAVEMQCFFKTSTSFLRKKCVGSCVVNKSVTEQNTYTIHTPAAMFKGFTVTQFQTPETAQALDKVKE